MSLEVTGTEQMRAVARDLSAAGLGGRRLRSRLRRNIVTTTRPIESEAQRGFDGYGPGLGAALASATRTRVRAAGSAASVSVLIDAGRLPEQWQSLPPLVEGFRPWKHPLYGNRERWYSQDSHPELGPAVKKHLPDVLVGCVQAVEETAEALARGSA